MLVSLLQTIISLMIAAFIIRYHCEIHHIIHFNPLARRLKDITEPVVLPVRDIVKKALLKTQFRPKNDPSPLIVAWLLSLITGLAFTRANLSAGFSIGTFWFFCGTWISVMIYSLFLSVIASWLQTPRQQPVLQIAETCHEFFMRPLRKLIPPLLNIIDITPIIAFIVLYMIKNQFLAALAFGAS